MQLVDFDLHEATYQHIGSSIYYSFFGLERKTQQIIEIID